MECQNYELCIINAGYGKAMIQRNMFEAAGKLKEEFPDGGEPERNHIRNRICGITEREFDQTAYNIHES